MIYVYRCEGCAEKTELEYRMGKQPDTIECPGCGEAARRVFTVPGITYNGTGWASHGVPDMDEREKQPGPLDFSDKYEEKETE